MSRWCIYMQIYMCIYSENPFANNLITITFLNIFTYIFKSKLAISEPTWVHIPHPGTKMVAMISYTNINHRLPTFNLTVHIPTIHTHTHMFPD